MYTMRCKCNKSIELDFTNKVDFSTLWPNGRAPTMLPSSIGNLLLVPTLKHLTLMGYYLETAVILVADICWLLFYVQIQSRSKMTLVCKCVCGEKARERERERDKFHLEISQWSRSNFKILKNFSFFFFKWFPLASIWMFML